MKSELYIRFSVIIGYYLSMGYGTGAMGGYIFMVADFLRVFLNQNEYLINLLQMSLFLIALFTGVMTNEFLNVLIIGAVIYETFKKNKSHSFDSIASLKTFMIFETIFIVEYIFISLVNITFINVSLNIIKLIFVSTIQPEPLCQLYDIYFEKAFDKLESLVMPCVDVKNISKNIDRNYDIVYHVKNGWTLCVNWGVSLMMGNKVKNDS
jgi:hypothetical protein